MRAAMLCLSAILVAAVAGCADEPASTQQAEPSPAQLAAQALTADANLTFADASSLSQPAWTLMAAADPGQGLAGFRWTVPEGSLIDDGDFEGLALRVTPLAQPAEAVKDFVVLVYSLDGEQATLEFVWVFAELSLSFKDVLPTDAQLLPAELSTLTVAIDEDDVEEGSELAFVVATDGELTSYGLALEVLADSDDLEDDAESPAEGLENLAGNGTVLAPFGQGDGLLLPLYVEYNMGPPSMFGFTVQSEDMTVDDLQPADARPSATARRLDLSFEQPGAGWGLGFGIYFGDQGAAQWEFDAAAHAEPFSEAGTTVFAWPFEVVPFVPTYYIAGGGDGPASLRMHLDVANRDEFEILEAVHLDLGADLPQLIGATHTTDDVFGGGQSAALEGRDLVWGLPGGIQMRAVNVVPPGPAA